MFELALLLCLLGQTPDSIRYEVDTLCAMNRVTGEEGSETAAAYLKWAMDGEYESFKFQTRRGDVRGKNIIKVVPGEEAGQILVCAHYDCMGGIGADDNASGVAAVLAIANSSIKFKHTVVYALFAAEEQGLVGSQFYANNHEKPIFVLNFDMIGHLKTSERTYGDKPDVEDAIRKVMAHYTFSKAITFRSGRNSDHYNFARKGVPVVHLFTGLTPTYHTRRDTPNTLNYEGICQIIEYAQEMLMAVDGQTVMDYSFTENLPVLDGDMK
ncbi:MAG: hypothetical protein AMXMBFR16_10930 [Candidatus Uhrbacteria bacterium]